MEPVQGFKAIFGDFRQKTWNVKLKSNLITVLIINIAAMYKKRISFCLEDQSNGSRVALQLSLIHYHFHCLIKGDRSEKILGNKEPVRIKHVTSAED